MIPTAINAAHRTLHTAITAVAGTAKGNESKKETEMIMRSPHPVHP